ncbi:hypothetical protein ASZ90_009502 [hydrocarbon metagenome]|uniref:Uncharacterized protein n=1 Tax=hydrocarbon metagenome TaxID=938273 RepID=A0A0W8FIL6_9ZZZZ
MGRMPDAPGVRPCPDRVIRGYLDCREAIRVLWPGMCTG